MRAIAIGVLSLAVGLAPGCGSRSRVADDAGVIADAMPAPDGAPDAGAAAAHVVPATRNVAGTVRASSTHYRLVGSTSAGGAVKP